MRRRAILFLMAGLFLVITVAGYFYLRAPAAVVADTRPLDAAGEKELKTLKGRAESLEKRLLGLAPKTATTYLVIDTGRNLLFMYENGKEVLKAICSTGSGRALVDPERKRRWTFDTPRGEFFIRAKHPNPVWIKPDWAFLEVGEPIPRKLAERLAPAELGAYAMDLGDGYLIHGTLYQRALGLSITHGCVRLGDKDLETVYDKVKIGTPVYIY
jgi:lipoprotein-anchoring transpeptidase ErfK/SrfK